MRRAKRSPSPLPRRNTSEVDERRQEHLKRHENRDQERRRDEMARSCDQRRERMMVRQAWNEGEYLMHLPAKGRSHLSTVLHMHRPFILVGALVLAACAAEPPAIETGPAADVAAAGTAETAAPACWRHSWFGPDQRWGL